MTYIWSKQTYIFFRICFIIQNEKKIIIFTGTLHCHSFTFFHLAYRKKKFSPLTASFTALHFSFFFWYMAAWMLMMNKNINIKRLATWELRFQKKNLWHNLHIVHLPLSEWVKMMEIFPCFVFTWIKKIPIIFLRLKKYMYISSFWWKIYFIFYNFFTLKEQKYRKIMIMISGANKHRKKWWWTIIVNDRIWKKKFFFSGKSDIQKKNLIIRISFLSFLLSVINSVCVYHDHHH